MSDDYAGNTLTTGVVAVGGQVTGNIELAADEDWFKVTLQADVTYVFDLWGLDGGGGTLGSGSAEARLVLYNPSGFIINSAINGGTGGDPLMSYTPTTSGVYYLAAEELYDTGTGTYTLRASHATPYLSIDSPTANESNGSLVFRLTLSDASASAYSVQISTTTTGTAQPLVDFTPQTTLVNFAPGQVQADFVVNVASDHIFEPSESIHLSLSLPSGLQSAGTSAEGFVYDDDEPYALPDDPMVRQQWHLYPGIGANALAAWGSVTGAGVLVGVFDLGIDSLHPDLNDNVRADLGRRAADLSPGGEPILDEDNHGTAVAGVIGAERNGVGTVGVAYGAGLVSLYGLGGTTNALTYARQLDILNNSWGYAPNTWEKAQGDWGFRDNFRTASFAADGQALKQLAEEGRAGLGTIVVQSAGNSRLFGDNTNLHNFQNSRYSITIAATDYFGDVTSYSSPGATVLVAAPGGDVGDIYPDILTTDRAGAMGYELGDYVSIDGTSFSAPLVSGVVALMLDANPNLGYRDVQQILSYSARITSAPHHDWRYNGADNCNGGGLHFDALSHDLGFGLVDALAAVRLAESWRGPAKTFSNDTEVTLSATLPVAIPDGSSSVTQAITVGQAITVERVEVTIDIDHTFIGDLSITLTSPSGTASELLRRPGKSAERPAGLSQDNIDFTFDTVLSMGESSVGAWSLTVSDAESLDSGVLQSWTLNLIGFSGVFDDVYIYTDEFSDALASSAVRGTLNDTSGIDVLNASTLTSASSINLVPGSTSTIDGRSLAISNSTILEIAYAGDANDSIWGNAVGNELFGMRGNDLLDGGAGNDHLAGGMGSDSIEGGVGADTVLFAGVLAEYLVSYDSGAAWFTVSDTVADRDGTDMVHGVEAFAFLDGTRSESTLIALTDTTPPTASSFSPADAVTGVAVGANIVLTFSEAIQRGTGNIVLRTAASAVVATYDAATSGNLSISGSTLTINPTADLSTGTQYFVEFPTGSVKDLAGNSYAGTTTYDFTTVVPQPLSKDDNFVAAQYASPAILGSGTGNDTYLLSSSLLAAGTSMTISDAVGTNSVQLAPGLAIASSRVGANALQITLANGSVITLLGAAAFGYDAAANSSAGIDGTDLGYASFAQQVLGVAVPTGSTLNTGGAVVIGGGTALAAFPAGTKSDDFVVAQYASPAILGAGTGDDTYLLSPQMLVAGTQMTISDAVGSNSVQLANGLDIASSRVAPGALQLTLVNGSVITVLGAAAFGYEAGGNRSAGIDGADLSYAAFALQVLGVAVPASGIAVGGPVLIGATRPAGTITVPVGSMALLSATAGADVVEATWPIGEDVIPVGAAAVATNFLDQA